MYKMRLTLADSSFGVSLIRIKETYWARKNAKLKTLTASTMNKKVRIFIEHY